MDGDASGDEQTEDEYDDLDGFIVADDVEFLISNYFPFLIYTSLSHIIIFVIID